jgi:hypothetical protein
VSPATPFDALLPAMIETGKFEVAEMPLRIVAGPALSCRITSGFTTASRTIKIKSNVAL